MSRPVAVFDPTKSTGIDQLLGYNQTWSQSILSTITPNLFTALAPAQVPKILWLGCSDSRVPETSLLGLNPGEVFTHRNIANLVNSQDVSFPSVLAYAMSEHVGTTHVILCGHVKCGGVATALGTALSGMPAVDAWLVPLKSLLARHVNFINSQADPAKALVTLSVQHGVKILKANNTIAQKSAVVVHGAIYDITTGLLSFLGETGQPPAEEPALDFMLTPNESIHVGSFSTTQVRSTPQTNTSMAYTFSQPYSKPPRIFMGLTSFDVVTHNDNPRMMCIAGIPTTTGFQISINTWGSSIINSASCTWLEIPDNSDYADFQTGAYATSNDHVWSDVRGLTTHQITFTKAYTAPPTVMVWLTGFDTAQNPAMSLSVYPTNITPTGFVMNLDTLNSVAVYGQWTNWVAFPTNSPFGLQTGVFGTVGATTQTTTGTAMFDQRDLNATVAPVVVGALNQVVTASPTSFKAKIALGNVTGSSVDWTTSTWGDATMRLCQGTFVTIPGLKPSSSVL